MDYQIQMIMMCCLELGVIRAITTSVSDIVPFHVTYLVTRVMFDFFICCNNSPLWDETLIFFLLVSFHFLWAGSFYFMFTCIPA